MHPANRKNNRISLLFKCPKSNSQKYDQPVYLVHFSSINHSLQYNTIASRAFLMQSSILQDRPQLPRANKHINYEDTAYKFLLLMVGGEAEQEQVILLRDSAGDNKVQILLLMTRPRNELMNGLPRDRHFSILR